MYDDTNDRFSIGRDIKAKLRGDNQRQVCFL